MDSGKQVMTWCRDGSLELVRNCLSAGTARKVNKAMKACERVKKSQTRIGSEPSKAWFLRVTLKFCE